MGGGRVDPLACELGAGPTSTRGQQEKKQPQLFGRITALLKKLCEQKRDKEEDQRFGALTRCLAKIPAGHNRMVSNNQPPSPTRPRVQLQANSSNSSIVHQLEIRIRSTMSFVTIQKLMWKVVRLNRNRALVFAHTKYDSTFIQYPRRDFSDGVLCSRSGCPISIPT